MCDEFNVSAFSIFFISKSDKAVLTRLHVIFRDRSKESKVQSTRYRNKGISGENETVRWAEWVSEEILCRGPFCGYRAHILSKVKKNSLGVSEKEVDGVANSSFRKDRKFPV